MSTLSITTAQEATIKHLHSLISSDVKGEGFISTVELLDEIHEVDDDNAEPLSDRVLWTAIQASNCNDAEVFLASVLSDYETHIMKRPTEIFVGFTVTEAIRTLREDTKGISITEIKELDPRFQAIAVYRSMHRLLNIHKYRPVDAEQVLKSVEEIKELTMSPVLFDLYTTVAETASDNYWMLSDVYGTAEEVELDELDELDEYERLLEGEFDEYGVYNTKG